MRLRATVLSLLLVLGLVAGACSSDDGDDEAVESDDTEQTEDTTADDDAEAEDEGDEEAGDLAAVVDGAQLELADFGEEGWELVSDAPDDDEEEDEPSPVDECVDPELQDAFDEAQVAESNERTFRRIGTGPVPAEVQSSSVGLDDAALFEQMHDILRSPEFSSCFGGALQAVLAESGGEATVGEIEQSDTVVDPGEDTDLQSTGITIPISMTVEGQTYELRATMIFLNTGPVGSSLFAFSPEGEVTAEHVAEWGGFLAERLAGAA